MPFKGFDNPQPGLSFNNWQQIIKLNSKAPKMSDNKNLGQQDREEQEKQSLQESQNKEKQAREKRQMAINLLAYASPKDIVLLIAESKGFEGETKELYDFQINEDGVKVSVAERLESALRSFIPAVHAIMD
ncbi:MAG: hypothetical protein ACJ75B_14755 [Flavisolibacter sp.]